MTAGTNVAVIERQPRSVNEQPVLDGIEFSDGRPAHEIEVTAAMKAAGLSALWSEDITRLAEAEVRELVAEIFKRMAEARPQ